MRHACINFILATQFRYPFYWPCFKAVQTHRYLYVHDFLDILFFYNSLFLFLVVPTDLLLQLTGRMTR